MYLKTINEVNENVSLTLKSAEDMVAYHAQKAAKHKDLYELTPDNSRFKKVHYDLWNHHEHQLNRAEFELHKQQVMRPGMRIINSLMMRKRELLTFTTSG